MVVGALLRATVADVPFRVTEAAVRRRAAVVVDLRIAVELHMAVARTAVDMGGKTTLDSAPA
jgi:hypothetical protein